MEDSTHSVSHSQLSLQQLVETQTSLSSPISNDATYVADCLCHLGHTSLRDLEIAKQLQLLSSSPIKRPFIREPSSPAALYHKLPSFKLEMPSSEFEEYVRIDHSALSSHGAGWAGAVASSPPPPLGEFEAQPAAARPTLMPEPRDEFEIKLEQIKPDGDGEYEDPREDDRQIPRRKQFRILGQNSDWKAKRRCVKNRLVKKPPASSASVSASPTKPNDGSLLSMEFHKQEKFPHRASWSLQDDQIIAYLKEEANYDWRDMAKSIGNRHTWQAVQMRYCRYLKRRSTKLSDHDVQILLKALEQDWNGRWSRIEKTMGPSFNRYRCQGAMLDLLGLSEQFGKNEKAGIGESFVLTGSEQITIPPLKTCLCDHAHQFIQERELYSMSDLVLLYLAPLELNSSMND